MKEGEETRREGRRKEGGEKEGDEAVRAPSTLYGLLSAQVTWVQIVYVVP